MGKVRFLTKESDYAIRALVFLALNPGCHSSATISRSTKLPLRYCRRILKLLTDKGLTFSKEGIRGGISLAGDPAKISLARIISIIQGDIRLSQCMFRKKICLNRRTCVLRKRLLAIERKLVLEFDNITIAGLANDLAVAGQRKR